jgi:2,4-dienoyl-CoA reductase-like NADH-dependent reductase (Old Yellow Enzyme family)
MPDQFEHLLKPLKLRTFEIVFCLAMPPLSIYISGSEGDVKQPLVHYYKTRAKGGVELIIVISNYVNHNDTSHPNQTAITHDKYIPGLRVPGGGSSLR